VAPESAAPGEGVSSHAYLQSDDALLSLCEHPREAVALFRRRAGEPIEAAFANAIPAECEELGVLPPLYPEWLGSAEFLQAHDLRFAYVAGEMARGIATVEMVLAMADARMLGFFGAAGLSLHEVEAAIDRIMKTPDMTRRAWGVNLIHSPNISGLENALVELFLAREVRRVSASAFLALSPAVVRYAFRGVRREPDGRIRRPNHLFAKVSRIEVARQFIAPPPLAMLAALVGAGQLHEAEADLAAKLPVAEDVTAEADSGGHTDNRPLSILLPALLALRRELGRANPACGLVRIGAAGGIGAPHAVAAAFALGADYVLTGSVNQASIESGLSPQARAMLASAGITDVMMAASADMFEMGVKVQVLRRGTLFGPRANKLYELYRTHESLDALPAATRAQLEKDVFRRPLADILAETMAFFAARDPSELARAERDPRHALALVFRWYLGLSSRWPINPDLSRQLDFQIWCGPAMGAFNDWTAGSFLAAPENRGVVQIALNLLEGAVRLTRAQQLRAAGLKVPSEAFEFVARPLS
jgi:PfaD family protein